MSDPSAPPPNYGAAVGSADHTAYPQPGAASTYQTPQEPPPKYEPPKTETHQTHNQYQG